MTTPRFSGMIVLAFWAGPLVAQTTVPSAPASPPDSAPATQPNIIWRDARELTVEGRGWSDTEGPYDRLPRSAKGKVTNAVWGLSKDSAGLCVRFVTDAQAISARWTVTDRNLAMEHMPATGVSGLDLYVKDGSTWRWVGAGRPRRSPTNESVLVDGLPPAEHEYLLYLPLYNGTARLEIGVAPHAQLSRAPARPAARVRPICFYGTSITQGGCASRPGMAHVAIIGRRLDWATINLGFSGSGKMELVMADLLAELDAAVYVLDCLPNMSMEMVKDRLAPFVEHLRKARPATPIVLIENTMPQSALYLPDRRQGWLEKNRALREVYDRLVQQGISGLTYVPADALLGQDGEAAVDGTHPTDLGFMRFAEALEPVLRKILLPT